MNFNRKAGKFTALALAAGSLIAGSGITANAAPLAGASKATASTLTTITASDLMKKTDNASNTISGVSAVLAKMVSSSEQSASKKTNTETKVASSETGNNTAADTSATETQASPYAHIGVANVSDYAFIRTAPDTNSDYAGKIYPNEVATVDGEEGDFYHVTSGDVTGYISKELLIVGDEAKVKSVAKTLATINTTTLKVRTAPDANASVLTLVAGTTEYTVTDTSTQGWVKIRTDAGEGYVSSEFVSIAESYSYAESKAAEEARIAQEQAAAQKAAAEKAAAQKAAAQKAAQKSASKSASSSSSKTVSAPSGSSGSSVVAYASQFVGNPYVYGGSSLTNGTDCSGFVKSVYAQFGVSLPHSSSAMRSCGSGVSKSDMQPGDIVCYSGHVGIYAGNGMIVNALNERSGITYTNVNYAPIVAVRRVK
jgi:cell wall-associated NlpC family hydrolase